MKQCVSPSPKGLLIALNRSIRRLILFLSFVSIKLARLITSSISFNSLSVITGAVLVLALFELFEFNEHREDQPVLSLNKIR